MVGESVNRQTPVRRRSQGGGDDNEDKENRKNGSVDGEVKKGSESEKRVVSLIPRPQLERVTPRQLAQMEIEEKKEGEDRKQDTPGRIPNSRIPLPTITRSGENTPSSAVCNRSFSFDDLPVTTPNRREPTPSRPPYLPSTARKQRTRTTSKETTDAPLPLRPLRSRECTPSCALSTRTFSFGHLPVTTPKGKSREPTPTRPSSAIPRTTPLKDIQSLRRRTASQGDMTDGADTHPAIIRPKKDIHTHLVRNKDKDAPIWEQCGLPPPMKLVSAHGEGSQTWIEDGEKMDERVENCRKTLADHSLFYKERTASTMKMRDEVKERRMAFRTGVWNLIDKYAHVRDAFDTVAQQSDELQWYKENRRTEL